MKDESFDCRKGQETVSILPKVKTSSGAHIAPILRVSGTLWSGLKRPGREADHLLLSSSEVEVEWSCISAPHICVHGVDTDNCTVKFKSFNKPA
jgi:hypothetical protein